MDDLLFSFAFATVFSVSALVILTKACQRVVDKLLEAERAKHREEVQKHLAHLNHIRAILVNGQEQMVIAEITRIMGDAQ